MNYRGWLMLRTSASEWDKHKRQQRAAYQDTPVPDSDDSEEFSMSIPGLPDGPGVDINKYQVVYMQGGKQVSTGYVFDSEEEAGEWADKVFHGCTGYMNDWKIYEKKTRQI